MILDIAEGQELPTSTAIEVLVKSKHNFYLTGSRYFGCATTASDWDFIADDTDDVRDFLTAQGFGGNLLDYASHRDTATNAVVQLNEVQVQLVGDVRMKRQARDGIKTFNGEYHRYAESSNRTRLWNDWLHILTQRVTRADAEAESDTAWW